MTPSLSPGRSIAVSGSYKRILSCLLLSSLLFSVVGAAAAQEMVDPGDIGGLDIYILAGQSNMSGRGTVPEHQPATEGIYVFGNDYRWREAYEPIDDPAGQIDSVSLDANAGFGPGLAFARALRSRHHAGAIGLVPCAKGATIIEEWKRAHGDDTLYGSCLKRALAASPLGTIRGLLFLQGESDAHKGATYHGHPRRPKTWADHFVELVANFRQDLNQANLPVAFAQIGPHHSPERYVNWEIVQDQQASVRVPHVAMIRTADLSLSDRVHFDTPSYEIIGQRFADAIAQLSLSPEIDLQGHRGARGLLPENTIPGILKALDLEVNTVEVDVAVTADGEVVLSHEPWMSSAICRTPDGDPISEADEHSFNIYRMSYDEVAGYDCGSRGNERFPRQRPTAAAKPLLRQVIRVSDGYAARTGRALPRYNIEIKSKPESDGEYHPAPDQFAERVYGLIESEGILSRTIVQSFDPRPIQQLRDIDPSLPLAFLVDNDLGYRRNIERLGFPPDVYSPHQRLVDEELIKSAHADGLLVIPWTVNERDAMDALLRLGVDGLITDYPGMGREAIDAYLGASE